AGAGARDDGVVAGHRIGPAAERDLVRAVAADDDVVGAAGGGVDVAAVEAARDVPRAAMAEAGDAVVAEDDVATAGGRDAVAPGAADDHVAAAVDGDGIVTARGRAGGRHLRHLPEAVAAHDAVVAAHGVVAAVQGDAVGTRAAEDGVDRVVAAGADADLDLV